MEELSSTRFSHLFGANQITFLSCGSLSSVRSTRLRVGLSDRRGCASRPSIRSSPSAWMPGRSLRRDREGAHKGWHGWKVDGCAGPRPMHFLLAVNRRGPTRLRKLDVRVSIFLWNKREKFYLPENVGRYELHLRRRAARVAGRCVTSGSQWEKLVVDILECLPIRKSVADPILSCSGVL